MKKNSDHCYVVKLLRYMLHLTKPEVIEELCSFQWNLEGMTMGVVGTRHFGKTFGNYTGPHTEEGKEISTYSESMHLKEGS
jgi:hypothetical protein